MIRQLIALTVLAAAVWQTATREEIPREDKGTRPTQVVRVQRIDPRLRSAFLVRAITESGRPSPYALSHASADEQLDAHFEAIDELLTKQTQRSLQIAVERYAAANEHPLSEIQKQRTTTMLARHREIQITRLREYRKRGRFPQNEGLANGAVPIFIDRHDTACAVGYLMQRWGQQHDVDKISQTNNLVYVTDATDGPVVDWIRQSGLTREEAALIQPAYPGDCGYPFGSIPISHTYSYPGLSTNLSLSATINPFGKPSTGTGVLIHAQMDGIPQAVTLQDVAFSSEGLVNLDAPATAAAGFLVDSTRVQRPGEAVLAGFLDAGISDDYVADDSYWGAAMTNALLGGGFNGSGNPGDTTMTLAGGTTFAQSFTEFDVIYLVTNHHMIEFSGEAAIGASTLIPFGGCFYGIPVPEPATFGQMLFAFALFVTAGRNTRRRGIG